jgi:tripeptide aminopeptidase
VDLDKLGADFGYTVDGGPLGSLEYENFNAASAEIAIQGVNIHPGDAKGKMKNAALIAAELVALVPSAESPAHTAGYEGFYHLCALTGDETSAALSWLIRDHDRESFQKRKDTMTAICSFLNRKYGEGTVKLTLTDSYYNMREKVEPHPEILDRARAAFRAAGVEPRDVPIRGGTDGAKLSFLGLPCPNLSTGGYHFHGVHEYIPVSALETMARVLVHLIAEEG